MNWLLIGLSCAAGLLIFEAIINLSYGAILLRHFEKKLDLGAEPSELDASAEPISFRNDDGVVLRGSLYAPPPGRAARGLILFCPELGGNHWSAMRYAAGLREAGFTILSFDFCNQGESDRRPNYDPLHWLTEFELQDLRAAINFSRTHPPLSDLPLGLLGISRGGGAALAAAAHSGDVRCVAADSAFSNNAMFRHYILRWGVLYVPEWMLRLLPLWHLNITMQFVRLWSQWRKGYRFVNLDRLLPRLKSKPVLLIAGSRDTYVNPQLANELYRRVGGDACEFLLIEGAKHNLARAKAPEIYDQRLVSFFSQLTNATVMPDARCDDAQPAVS